MWYLCFQVKSLHISLFYFLYTLYLLLLYIDLLSTVPHQLLCVCVYNFYFIWSFCCISKVSTDTRCCNLMSSLGLLLPFLGRRLCVLFLTNSQSRRKNSTNIARGNFWNVFIFIDVDITLMFYVLNRYFEWNILVHKSMKNLWLLNIV